jgi:hypothetical protein
LQKAQEVNLAIALQQELNSDISSVRSSPYIEKDWKLDSKQPWSSMSKELLTLQFLGNALFLAFTSFSAIFSKTSRDRLAPQARETFVNAPARAYASCLQMFDYLKYKRMHLRYGGDP